MVGLSPHLLAEQLSAPQGMPALPPLRDFLTSAGFGGALALGAAIVVAIVVVFAERGSSRRHVSLLDEQKRQQDETRRETQRSARLQECRERLAWVVDKGGIEPSGSEAATVGFGPELALTVLEGIRDDAEQLGDATLAKAAAVQITQLSRILAKQSGALSELGVAAPETARSADSPTAAAPESNGSLDAPAVEAQAPSTPARKVSAAGRRHRQ